tara:strand:- start:340 stop:786 length:447 start_codon:yes stop_codon:yes gene_type:complete
MTVQTNAGTAISVSIAAPATHDDAGFAALTYTLIGEIVTTGTKGPSVALVTHSPLDKRAIQKYKGTVNYGTYSMGLGLDIADAGQVLLKAGADGAQIDVVHSFKEVKQNGDIEYYRAVIMSFDRAGGGNDAVLGANTSLELTDSIIDA